MNCSYGECSEGKPIVKAGWAFTLGSLASVEQLTDEHGNVVRVMTQDWMQSDLDGGELYDPNDTCDFYLADE